MIQKTSQRQLNAVIANARPAVNEPEEWGQWIRNKHYSLEVTQHPQRARMCGFGDKDRRPLAPAAVAKMIVRREDNSILDVDDIDVDFFVVTVDLWSADGKREMNLVLHPSSLDRFIAAHVAKPRKKGLSSAGPSSTPIRPSRPSPYPTPHERPRPLTAHPPVPGPGPSFALRPIEPTPTGSTPLLTPVPTPSYNTPGYPFPTTDPFTGAIDATNPWSYPPSLDRTPFQAPTLPSIHSIGRKSPAPSSLPADINPASFHVSEEPDLITPFRAWNDVATGLFDSHNVDPVLRDTGVAPRWSADAMMIPSIPPEVWPPASQHFQPFGQTLVQPQNPPQPQPQPQPHPQPHPQLQQEDQQQPHHRQQHQEEQPSLRDGQHTIPSLPRHTYTRTLVGPLSANAQRLQDEHRKPGIFFLFQDLSIRTEGTFRLRMRLMNVGIPPAPNGLSNSVHTGVSPVLAQIFTEPFTVYSAKRFPGVPSTTALSIAFGNQGQKLPLRNRHKQQLRPRRSGSASSDDESS